MAENLNSSTMQVFQRCEDFKVVVLSPDQVQAYEVLALIAPNNSTIWAGRNGAWNIIFYMYITIMTALFLALGFISLFLLFKKDCVRLKSKIFFTVYTCIAILGFSRALWLVLDPFGLVGFIAEPFPGWFVISTILESLGFPSLVACYTVIIATLFLLNSKPGKQSHHSWIMAIPVLLTPYILVFIAQIISLTVSYPGVLGVVVCEFFFAVWGILVCLLFLLAGKRLLRKVSRRQLRSIKVSDSTMHVSQVSAASKVAARQEFVSRENKRHQENFRRPLRKIALITYTTMLFTILYSLITAARGALTVYLLFGACLGFQEQTPASAWLVLEVSHRIVEVLLALVLLYSVTDVSQVTTFFCSKVRTRT